MKFNFFLTTLLLFSVLTGRARLCVAEYISPELIQVSTPVYKPDFSKFNPKLGNYKYQVSWQGLPAAEANIKIELRDEHYRITATANTYSPISVFYNLKYKAEGLLSLADFSPIRTTIEQRENSKIKNTDIQFLDDGNIHAIRSQNNNEAPKVLDFNPDNFMLEPFSAAFIAKSMDWELGQTRDFDTFNGKSRYIISLTAKDKQYVDVGDTEKEAWMIVPTVKNLTDSTANSKLKNATIFVTTDDSHDIVKIASKVFIGTVNTKLIDFTPDLSVEKTVLAKNITNK